MGIKFRCPNGHKLHVKSFLAGKKGVCPKCGIRVDVPLATNLDEAEDAPTPPGGIQLGPAPAAPLFPIPAPPPGRPAPAPYVAPPQPYVQPQAYAPPHDPFGLPAAALPQPAAPVAAGGRTYARPIPIPMPAPFSVPAAPASFPGPAAPVAGPPQTAPIAVPQDDLFAGLLPGPSEVPWNPNMPLAAPAAGPAPREAHALPAKRGGLNLGRNGTILLVFVAAVLVGALIWVMIQNSSGPAAKPTPPPEPAKTESSLRAPLDSSPRGLL